VIRFKIALEADSERLNDIGVGFAIIGPEGSYNFHLFSITVWVSLKKFRWAELVVWRRRWWLPSVRAGVRA